MENKRIIIGITGASGAIFGIRCLEHLRALGFESHLVISRSAKITIGLETKCKLADVMSLSSVSYDENNIAAAISSGSFRTLGMIVAPCSMRSLGEIASGVTSSLLTRAADVCLKERRRLVLLTRETPLHLGHLRSMTSVTEMGGVICPPVPAFYNKPLSIDDIVNHTVGRVLDLFGIDSGCVKRWK